MGRQSVSWCRRGKAGEDCLGRDDHGQGFGRHCPETEAMRVRGAGRRGRPLCQVQPYRKRWVGKVFGPAPVGFRFLGTKKGSGFTRPLDSRYGSPNGIRTRVSGVRGQYPRPLDDGTKRLAGGLGFEPRLADPESAVLPLDDPPTKCRESNGISLPSQGPNVFRRGGRPCCGNRRCVSRARTGGRDARRPTRSSSILFRPVRREENPIYFVR